MSLVKELAIVAAVAFVGGVGIAAFKIRQANKLARAVAPDLIDASQTQEVKAQEETIAPVLTEESVVVDVVDTAATITPDTTPVEVKQPQADTVIEKAKTSPATNKGGTKRRAQRPAKFHLVNDLDDLDELPQRQQMRSQRRQER